MTSKISRHGLMKNISGSEAFGIQKKEIKKGTGSNIRFTSQIIGG
ncbi:hypothetical protein BACIH_3265 [Bacillus amyloliquefaciens]|nr:hypothetical protein BACIH_3265 [Bacillus amyloliquefaciens]